MPSWMVIDPSPDLEPGEKRSCLVQDREILVCRVGDAYFGVAPRCPHAAWPLVDEPLEGFRLRCTLHGACFDVRDGCPTAGPTTKSLDTYPIERREGHLYVSL